MKKTGTGTIVLLKDGFCLLCHQTTRLVDCTRAGQTRVPYKFSCLFVNKFSSTFLVSVACVLDLIFCLLYEIGKISSELYSGQVTLYLRLLARPVSELEAA